MTWMLSEHLVRGHTHHGIQQRQRQGALLYQRSGDFSELLHGSLNKGRQTIDGKKGGELIIIMVQLNIYVSLRITHCKGGKIATGAHPKMCN